MAEVPAGRGGLVEELDRLSKLRALDDYLDELEATLGPISPEEQAAAAKWVEGLLAE